MCTITNPDFGGCSQCTRQVKKKFLKIKKVELVRGVCNSELTEDSSFSKNCSFKVAFQTNLIALSKKCSYCSYEYCLFEIFER